MSNEQSLDQSRRRKRDVIRAPFRQGIQWAARQFDDFRSSSESPRSARPSSPRTTAVSPSGAIPPPHNEAREQDTPAPRSGYSIPSSNPLETSLPSLIQVPENIPFAPKEDSSQHDHGPSPLLSSTNQAQDGCAESSSLEAAHRGRIYEGLRDASGYRHLNIGTMVGNVFTGVNKGYLNMTVETDDFTRSYPSQLKVSAKADHRYYANRSETALRRSSCTAGTRVDILQGIMYWAINMSPSGERVYWLSGQAGAGKTTIAYTIARQFETLIIDGNSRVILGASFFCSRQFLETRSASAIIRTIVYHLALLSKPFQTALKEYGKFETVEHGPRSQLIGLLVEPWKKSAPERKKLNEPCYVVPIDALDELEGTGGVDFLSTLFDVVDEQDLSGLKFFVTSRSEPALVTKIAAFPNKQVCRLEEVPLDQSSADIKVYLNENLAECTTTEQIQQLVSDAAGLFIYAATVVEYVKGRDVEEQKSILQQLLSTSLSSSSVRRPSRGATATLDNLYLQILDTSLIDPRECNDLELFQDCLSILHTLLCTVERTSTSVAVDILNASRGNDDTLLNDGIAKGVLRRLYAILYSQDGQVMWFHKSFPDFIFDKRRSQRFYCNQGEHHHRLTRGCFEVMTEQLRFNIANIPSSYPLDCDNTSLPAWIDANISRSLRYACGNWSGHLIFTSHEAPDRLAESLDRFLPLQILFWMEAMNLLGKRGHCGGMLRDAKQWSQKCKGSADLVSKLADAAAFATHHSTSKATLSTPHLYLSSLATFSRPSAIVQLWKQQFGGIPGFISAHGVGEAVVASIRVGKAVNALAVSPDSTNVAVGFGDDPFLQIWDLSTGEEVMVLKGHTNPVRAVAYSPNGTHLASASYDRSVRVWDLSTREQAGVLNGHTDWVQAVAYSPDGTRVVSGSHDRSVRVWDLSTGEQAKVLSGHTDYVTAVAYSPDGTHAASGSDDHVRVWDLSTGEQVQALKGHRDLVRAVAYSTDGAHVISGSWDCSVRVWDLSTGQEVKVLEGHTGWVSGVACSPDGAHIVSSSDDRSVRVWNLSTGEHTKVLKGHTASVRAVAYSPDGNHVVSGSWDHSVRVWDLSAGEDAVVIKGHTASVRAVAYSPDGNHVVSGSWDNSVRVWNLPTGEEAKVLNGHTDWVQAVAYSPDASHVASGSQDTSVRVWDLSTGDAKILTGHTDHVTAVAYSPDGTHVVSGSDDYSVRVWDLFTGEEVLVLEGHTDTVTAVVYSPDGTHVVSCSLDRSVRVWDLSTEGGVNVLKGHTDAVIAIAYSPGGTHVVSGSHEGLVRVWDPSTGEEARVLKGHTHPVKALAFSPDGTHLVSASTDKSVRVWDLSTGEETRVLEGHTKDATAVVYSPDGTHIASCSDDRSVRVWNVSPKLEHGPRYIRQKGSDGQFTAWLVSPTIPSAYLMFVPPTANLPDDSNVITFPTSAVPYLDFSNAKLGDRWAECYTP